MGTKDREIELFRKNLEDNIDYLEENLGSIYDKGDRNFAENLCDFYTNKGYVSDKQVFHMLRFFGEVGGKLEDTVTTGLSQNQVIKRAPQIEASPARVVVNGAPIVQLFDTAAKFLQRPKIVYRLPVPVDSIDRLVFYRTTERSHAPGSVGVVNGEMHPNNQLLATIYRDKPAAFYPFSFGKPQIQQLIKRIAEEPQLALRYNGLETVHCCYCSQRLTDPRSITAGYGPICASNWGLPWGEELPQLRLKGV